MRALPCIMTFSSTKHLALYPLGLGSRARLRYSNPGVT